MLETLKLTQLPESTAGASPLDTKLVDLRVQATKVGVSPWILRTAARRKGIPIVKLGRKLFVSEAEALRLLTPQ